MMNSDAYDRYLNDIAQYPRITPARERELSRIIQICTNAEQVEAAVNELIQSNLRLVIHCQKEFDKHLNSGSARMSALDLIAEGNIGLMKAARNFNTAFHPNGKKPIGTAVRFSTYACKCIKSHMLRAIKKSRFIHIPEHHFSYWTEMDALHRENGERMSDRALQKHMELSEEALSLIKLSARTGVSMLEDLPPAEDDSNWNDFIADDDTALPCEEAETHDLRAFLNEEMESLAPRTRQIIAMLYFNDNAPTLKEISGIFGISSERCRQICMKGLALLRRQLFTRRHGIDPVLARTDAVAA